MPAIRVKAARRGHYVNLKNPGDVFMVAAPSELGSWMEPADPKDQPIFDKEFAARKARRAQARTDGSSKMERMANLQAEKFGKRRMVPVEMENAAAEVEAAKAAAAEAEQKRLEAEAELAKVKAEKEAADKGAKESGDEPNKNPEAGDLGI